MNGHHERRIKVKYYTGAGLPVEVITFPVGILSQIFLMRVMGRVEYGRVFDVRHHCLVLVPRHDALIHEGLQLRLDTRCNVELKRIIVMYVISITGVIT